MPKNVQTTTQLHSFHLLSRSYSKSSKLGFSSMRTESFPRVHSLQQLWGMGLVAPWCVETSGPEIELVTLALAGGPLTSRSPQKSPISPFLMAPMFYTQVHVFLLPGVFISGKEGLYTLHKDVTGRISCVNTVMLKTFWLVQQFWQKKKKKKSS